MTVGQHAWPRLDANRDWTAPQGDDPTTLYRMMAMSAERFGDQPCISYKPAGPDSARVNLSYAEFHEMVLASARALRDRGVGVGDRVAMILDNSPEWGVTAYATNALGGVYTSMYTNQHGKEWTFIIGDSGPKVLVMQDRDCLERLIDAMPKDASAWPSGGVILLGDDAPEGQLPEGVDLTLWRDMVAQGREASDLDSIADDAMALASLIYTSGTTGEPKGVMLSNWNSLSNILAVQSVFPLYVGDRNAAFAPWAHSLGSLIDLHYAIRSGIHIHLISTITRIADECQHEIKPHFLMGVPKVWNKFYERVNAQLNSATGLKKIFVSQARKRTRARLDAAGVDCDAVPPTGFLDKRFDGLVWGKVRARFGGELKMALSGSAALAPEVAEFLQMVGFSVYEGYGLTETAPIVSANGWMGVGKSKLNTIGPSINGVRVEIDTEAWDDPERPDEGEIIVHGPNVMMGYWNREDATKAVIREDGGFRTGDLGKLDEDGYVVITGRVKSQFKLSNGKYVSPAPLEENVKLSPLVEMAALDGKDMPSTFLIVYPVEEALRAHLTAQGIDASGSLEDLCGRPEVRASVLEELRSKNMEPPVWKGYEKAKHLILDPVEWTPDNNMLTPTQKVKLRNLLDRHADAIQVIRDA